MEVKAGNGGGKSIEPLKRLSAIKSGNPDKLQILGTLEGDREKELHHRFSEYRISPKREWFSLGPDMMDFLKAEFKCVLRQNGRRVGKRTKKAEGWDSIVDRAEKLL